MTKLEEYLQTNWIIRSVTVRVFLAEFLGTLVLVSILCGSRAQTILSSEEAGSGVTYTICGGLAPAFGIYVSGGVSGGHVNPALTFALCILGRTKWRLFPVYICAQYLGGFVGASLVYGTYIDAINVQPDGKSMNNSAIFGTFPNEWLTVGNGLLDQIYCTALLLIMFLALNDKKNMCVPRGLIPLAMGFTVIAIGLAFGYNAMAPLNPARDLSPRLFALWAGWPDEMFEFRDFNWFWIPLVGTNLGAVFGAFIYVLFIEIHEHDDATGESSQSDIQTVEGMRDLEPDVNDHYHNDDDISGIRRRGSHDIQNNQHQIEYDYTKIYY